MTTSSLKILSSMSLSLASEKGHSRLSPTFCKFSSSKFFEFCQMVRNNVILGNCYVFFGFTMLFFCELSLANSTTTKPCIILDFGT